MYELFRDILKSDAGSFGFVFCFFAICFIGVWKISHFSTKFSSIDKLETAIDKIKEDIHLINANIAVIKEKINPLGQRFSPISLTIEGKQFSDELDVPEIVGSHWDLIHKDLSCLINKKSNSYYIQEACFEVGDRFQEYVSKTELEKIKTHAINAGYDLGTYNLLFGITIRDKILNSTKGG